MEKKFTLMKTLTAFLDLLFPRRKNSRTVNNNQASTTGGCGTAVHDHFKYVNDAKQVDASFLFFEQAVDDQQSIDHGQPSIEKDQKLRSKEELKKINDELALGSLSKPVYKNWKQRVNDDMAACCPVVSRESVIVSRESITVINVLENIFPKATTVNNETRTNKNDASLPFASFSFFVSGSVAEGSFFSTIISAVSKSFRQESFNKNLKPVFLPIPQPKVRFRGSVTDQNRFK